MGGKEKERLEVEQEMRADEGSRGRDVKNGESRGRTEKRIMMTGGVYQDRG